jgi:hypothetical protein
MTPPFWNDSSIRRNLFAPNLLCGMGKFQKLSFSLDFSVERILGGKGLRWIFGFNFLVFYSTLCRFEKKAKISIIIKEGF